MIRNYFKIAYRNLLKNKVYAVINIFGLAIGMAACFFIFQYVHFEKSYDKFNKNAADIYRVTISFSGSFSNLAPTATNHPAVGPAMKADFPEVRDFARVVHSSIFTPAVMMSYTHPGGATKIFNEEKLYIVDPSFLTIFSFPFIQGNPANALSEPNTVVISKSTAEKYFGNENPLGKTIVLNKDSPLKVTGVFADVPENSHIKFDILVSFMRNGGDKFGYDMWSWPEFYNYVLLAPGTDPKKIEARFPAFINKYLGAIMKQLNFGSDFHLQPLTSIHLKSNYLKEAETNGSERDVYFLSIIGVFILLIAWINYINLSTAKSLERAKEVGLRKVVGAAKIQLITQFILESVILNFFALLLAIVVVLICMPYYSQFIGKTVASGSLSPGLWHEPWFWLALVIVFILGAMIVGAYPAFMLSSFKPALVLKGKFNQSGKGTTLKRTLVSFQFVLSILLIAGTIIVFRQLSFMQNGSLGYNKDQMVIVKAPAARDSTYNNRIRYFKEQLSKSPSVINVSACSDVPGKTIVDRNTVRRAGQDETHNFITYLMSVDESFINTYKMTLAAGRNFQPQERATFNKDDHPKVIVNEVVVKATGFKNNEDALHQNVVFAYGPGVVKAEIIGVVKNYHQRSLKESYDPILYFYPDMVNWQYLSVNLKANNIRHGIDDIQSLYNNTFSGNAFEYFFLNDFFNLQYQSDQRFGRVFTLFTILTIFVSCLGLLGLSSYVIKLKTKEIGIRKVLGASVSSILVLFTGDFIRLVFLSAIIATPIIYFGASRWLENYAFHINLNWLIFILPPLLLLIIAVVTILLQSLKTALADPVKSLRSE